MEYALYFASDVRISVAAAGAIVAVGVSANLWLFLWGPLADLTLTPKRWYLIGLTTGAGAVFVLSLLPFQQSAAAILTIMESGLSQEKRKRDRNEAAADAVGQDEKKGEGRSRLTNGSSFTLIHKE